MEKVNMTFTSLHTQELSQSGSLTCVRQTFLKEDKRKSL